MSDKRDNNNQHEDEWVESAISQHLDSKVENLDYNVTSRLKAARYRALEQAQSPSANNSALPNWLNWQGLAGTVAVAGLALFIGMQLYPNSSTTISNSDQSQVAATPTEQLMQDMTILSASDDIEFYQSIEFLEWMASNSG